MKNACAQQKKNLIALLQRLECTTIAISQSSTIRLHTIHCNHTCLQTTDQYASAYVKMVADAVLRECSAGYSVHTRPRYMLSIALVTASIIIAIWQLTHNMRSHEQTLDAHKTYWTLILCCNNMSRRLLDSRISRAARVASYNPIRHFHLHLTRTYYMYRKKKLQHGSLSQGKAAPRQNSGRDMFLFGAFVQYLCCGLTESSRKSYSHSVYAAIVLICNISC